MQKFIILGIHRTGSVFLQSLLDSHSQIKAGGELFNPGWKMKKKFRRELPTKAQRSLVRTRIKRPIRFLEQAFFGHYAGDYDVVGFRLFYNQGILKDGSRPIWDYLRELPDLKVLHLKRRNILARYCSLKLARRTKVWGVSDSASHLKRMMAFGKKSFKPVHLDYSECLKVFEKTRRWEEGSEHFFKNVPMMEILYENLAGDYVEVTNLIQDFLGVQREKLSSSRKKQNIQPLSESISSYDQLKKQFAGTQWIEFFEE